MPDRTYVAQGLRGIWIRKLGFIKMAGFSTRVDVVNHYDNFKKQPSKDVKNDLVEYLKSR